MAEDFGAGGGHEFENIGYEENNIQGEEVDNNVLEVIEDNVVNDVQEVIEDNDVLEVIEV